MQYFIFFFSLMVKGIKLVRNDAFDNKEKKGVVPGHEQGEQCLDLSKIFMRNSGQ